MTIGSTARRSSHKSVQAFCRYLLRETSESHFMIISRTGLPTIVDSPSTGPIWPSS